MSIDVHPAQQINCVESFHRRTRLPESNCIPAFLYERDFGCDPEHAAVSQTFTVAHFFSLLKSEGDAEKLFTAALSGRNFSKAKIGRRASAPLFMRVLRARARAACLVIQ
jgi:hypothetical protein